MKEVTTVIERCRRLGAILIPFNDDLKVRAPMPLPDELIADLKELKPQLILELKRELKTESECWMLEEWRRLSLPDWRRILIESIETHNTYREEYARWMLKEILQDPEYKELRNGRR